MHIAAQLGRIAGMRKAAGFGDWFSDLDRRVGAWRDQQDSRPHPYGWGYLPNGGRYPKSPPAQLPALDPRQAIVNRNVQQYGQPGSPGFPATNYKPNLAQPAMQMKPPMGFFGRAKSLLSGKGWHPE